MQKTIGPQTKPFLEIDDDEYLPKVNDWNNLRIEEKIVLPKKSVKTDEGLNKSFQAQGYREIIKPWEIKRLKKGDHVAWHRSYIIYHHAIVIDIDVETRMIKVIHSTKNKIVEQWIDLDSEDGVFYRMCYSEDTLEKNPVDRVLQRAREKLGNTDYKLFTNNCEHFATYCKTGKAVSNQVHWAKCKAIESAADGALSQIPEMYNTARRAGKEACKYIANGTAKVAQSGGKIARAFANETRKQGFKSVADSTAKVATSETVEKVSKSSNLVGAGLVAAFEIGTCAWDIYQLRKKRLERKISKQDYKMNVTQRVAEGIVGTALTTPGSLVGAKIGAWIGGTIGSVFPGIGTAAGAFVGGVVGGMVGSFVGKAIGSMFGSWLGRWWYG